MRAGNVQPKKLVKIIIKEISTNKVVMELLPCRKNESKAANMAAMADVEVIRVYE